MRVIFIKSHHRRNRKRVVGELADFDPWLADELIEKQIVKEYKGPWPPPKGRKGKTKINLKDLK